MADAIERFSMENDESVSGIYKEAIRRMAQDPDHPFRIRETTRMNDEPTEIEIEGSGSKTGCKRT